MMRIHILHAIKAFLLFLLTTLFAGNIVFANPQDSVDVINYGINLNVTDFENKELTGFTILTLKTLYDNQNQISLHFQGLTVDSIVSDDVEISGFYREAQILYITTGTSLSPDDTVDICVYYHGHPDVDPTGWGGFYFKNSTAFNLGVAMEENPHCYGRVWYPCIDDFVDRATYDYRITVLPTHSAVCSGMLQEITENEDSSKTFYWRLEKTIPTYLSSIAVGEYELYENIYHGINEDIPTDIYTLPDDSAIVAGSFIHLNEMMEAFESAFGAFNWPRVGYVWVDFSGGAMEHATNIALMKGAFSGTLSYETLIAHELAHNWFGNQVTCETAGEMWLNEGWASYSEAIFVEYLYGKNSFKNYVRDNLHSVLRSAHSDDDGFRAVYGIPHEYTYGTTVYDKGSLVAHTLRGYMGDDLFFPAITNYLEEFAFAHAGSEDFKNSLEQHSGMELDDFFDFWVYSPGF